MIRLVLLVALAGLPMSAFAITFKIATISPDGLSWMKKFRKGVAEIESRTEGRVNFKIYPGGVQGDDQSVLRKMRIGQLHGAVVAAGSLTRFYPDLQVYNLPLEFRSFDEVDYVRERMDRRIAEGLERNGLVTFPFVETGFAYILSQTPVKTVEDLKNVTVWAPTNDPIVMKLLQSMGLTPVPLNITDVLAGLETGLVDSVTVPPVVAIALQWHNHVQYMTTTPVMYIYSMLAMDKETFERLNKADRQIVNEVLGAVFREIDEENRSASQKAYKALLEQGIKPVKPSPAQLQKWYALAESATETIVKSGKISRESMAVLNSHLNEIRTQSMAGN